MRGDLKYLWFMTWTTFLVAFVVPVGLFTLGYYIWLALTK